MKKPDLIPEEKARRWIRRLIWLYFWLLIIEGALRKWVVPQLSNPLLVIRDPVALAIFLFSFRARAFPWNGWVLSLIVIGIATTAATFIQLVPYLPLRPITLVAGYGIHANFFHLPLIFVMAKVMSWEDVKKIGWWTLLLVIPISLLMIAQFRAAPDAFLNRTAGGEGEMMLSALGKVRTAGPFSFVIGVVAYFSIAVAYLLWAMLKPGVYRTWLLWAAGAAVCIGIAVSGSRSVVAACALVVASLAVVFVFNRGAMSRAGQMLLVGVVVAFIVSRTPIFREGVNVLFTRFTEVAEATEQSIARGLIGRVFAGVSDAVFVLNKAPAFGYGLGIGTNAGANILTGNSMFLLTEGEWSRLILESGPIIGIAYILWRIALACWVFWQAVKCVKKGQLLPVFLFAAGFMSLVNGQFGQPTILGFAVFTIGLALAAAKGAEVPVDEAGTPPHLVRDPRSGLRPVRGRSAYAERLHGPPPERSPTNGIVGR